MTPPPVDPSHWLYRLTAPQWLDAAAGELQHSETALRARQQRRGLAHARRAAGMALNGLLVVQPREEWGRSYVEHLRAVASDASLPPQVTRAAAVLVDSGAEAVDVVQIGRGSDALADAARTVATWCEELVHQALAASGELG